MPANWYLFQYTADLKRHEPKNVGVALEAPYGWHFQFRGVSDATGKVDGQQLRDLKVDKDLYGAWVKYFRRKASEGEWEVAMTLQHRRPSNFSVIRGGVLLKDSAAWDMETVNLFNELVDVPQSNVTIYDAAWDVIKRSGLNAEKNIGMNGSWRQGGPQVSIPFKFGVHQRKSGIHLVDVAAANFNALTGLRARMDAVSRVQDLPPLVALVPLSRHQESGDGFEALLNSVEEDGHILDVDNERTVDDLRERFHLS